MFKNLQNIIQYNSRFYLIGVTSIEDRIESIIMLVKHIKGEIIIEERLQKASYKDLNKNIPVILHVDGEGVISKRIKKEIGYRNNLVFGANIDDFHFYEYSQEEHIYTSIVRKSHINKILSRLSKENLTVLHFCVGPFVLANMLSMIKGEKAIYISDFIIEVNNGKIQSFSTDGVALETQEINGEQLNFEEIPLMASALDFLCPKESIGSSNEIVVDNIEDYKFKKLFKISGMAMLGVIMLSLIIGHFLKSHYTVALAEKAIEYSMYEQTVSKIKSLKDQRELKERILSTSGITNKNFLVKYISEIGNTVPEDVQLILIDIMPPEKKIRPDKKVILSLGTISISGETSNDISFNQWMASLRSVDWVKAVNIEYSEDQSVSNTFTLKVKI